MIGVIAKAHQTAAVDEFFQLFKTPWESFRSGRTYDVVVATADEIPEVDARLLVIYGAGFKNRDATEGVVARSRHRGGSLNYGDIDLPAYGEVVTFEAREAAIPCVSKDTEVAGLRICTPQTIVVRLGYDLFDEVGFLLSAGQPLDHAHIPTLDIHVIMLREWVLSAGITLLEIPPAPAGYTFAVCLTHDIDFTAIRNHLFDHTMWGFLYRATVGATRNFLRGRFSVSKLLKSWRAAASLPFVYLGWVKDFWDPFGWYLRVEQKLPATYFFIPFKRRPGDRVAARHPSRRAAAYELSDLADSMTTLLKEGCELSVHGIDAWHSVAKGRDELARIAAVTGESSIGVRIHWLLRDENTFPALEEAGFAYDSTVGYNETIGYRSGTAQVFRPAGVRSLLELPLHVQDGALFFPHRLDLSESDAWKRCRELIDHARTVGGVLTVLWHDRSHGPERFWGEFYVRLVEQLKSLDPWFGTARQITSWFRKRREVTFEGVRSAHGPDHLTIRYSGDEIDPPLTLRLHYSDGAGNGRIADFPWTGSSEAELGQLLRTVTNAPAQTRLPIPSPS